MKSRTRKIIILLFTMATLAAVAYAVHLSLNPDLYFFYTPEDRTKWSYHPGGVAFVCGVMLIEAVVACLAVVASRPKTLWVRCFIGLLALGTWAFFSTRLVVHVPGYALFHHLWVWLLVLVLTATIMRQLIQRIRKGPSLQPRGSG